MNGTNGNGQKTFMGVRYEPSISTGSIILLLGLGAGGVNYYLAQEHRLTVEEDRQVAFEGMIQARIDARKTSDEAVQTEIGVLDAKVEVLSLRVYRLELLVIPKSSDLPIPEPPQPKK